MVRRHSFAGSVDALSDAQRRELLVALLDSETGDESPLVVADSGPDVVGRTPEMDVDAVHLSRLEKYGFIRWDEENNEVATGANFDEIKPILEQIAERDGQFPLAGIS